MTDQRIRELERAARTGDPSAVRRLDAARDRAGLVDEQLLEAFDKRVRMLLDRANGLRANGLPHSFDQRLTLEDAQTSIVAALGFEPGTQAAPSVVSFDRNVFGQPNDHLFLLGAHARNTLGDFVCVGVARVPAPSPYAANGRVPLVAVWPSLGACFAAEGYPDSTPYRQELVRAWALRPATGPARRALAPSKIAREWARRVSTGELS